MGITGLYSIGFTYGGPVGVVWGWVVVSFFSMFVASSMAELCSSLPVRAIYLLHFFLFLRMGLKASFQLIIPARFCRSDCRQMLHCRAPFSLLVRGLCQYGFNLFWLLPRSRKTKHRNIEESEAF
jgi:hypothetical protein